MADEVPSRFETLFNIRYASRVLERYARMWQRIDVLLRFLAIVSGMSAIGAIWKESATATIISGALFAVFQALELAIAAPKREQAALTCRRAYAGLIERASGLGDAALDAEYRKIVRDDENIVPYTLKCLAYNDVVEEKGCDLANCYPVNGWLRFASWVV